MIDSQLLGDRWDGWAHSAIRKIRRFRCRPTKFRNKPVMAWRKTGVTAMTLNDLCFWFWVFFAYLTSLIAPLGINFRPYGLPICKRSLRWRLRSLSTTDMIYWMHTSSCFCNRIRHIVHYCRNKTCVRLNKVKTKKKTNLHKLSPNYNLPLQPPQQIPWSSGQFHMDS